MVGDLGDLGKGNSERLEQNSNKQNPVKYQVLTVGSYILQHLFGGLVSHSSE